MTSDLVYFAAVQATAIFLITLTPEFFLFCVLQFFRALTCFQNGLNLPQEFWFQEGKRTDKWYHISACCLPHRKDVVVLFHSYDMRRYPGWAGNNNYPVILIIIIISILKVTLTNHIIITVAKPIITACQVDERAVVVHFDFENVEAIEDVEHEDSIHFIVDFRVSVGCVTIIQASENDLFMMRKSAEKVPGSLKKVIRWPLFFLFFLWAYSTDGYSQKRM